MKFIITALDIAAVVFLIIIGVSLLFSLSMNKQYAEVIAEICCLYLFVRLAASL